MTNFVIAQPKVYAIPVVGEAATFPVGRIFCIGRNYAAHAVEMGHDPSKEPPFFFLKPQTAICLEPELPYPSGSTNVHHEVEMIVALGGGGTSIPEHEALALVYGYGVGIDLTRRDLQDVAKAMARPWDASKGFDNSAPCGPLLPVARAGHPSSGPITLSVNGELRQSGDLNQMIWKTAGMISELSRYFELRAGDVIMTGTPSGVGPVVRGDVLRCEVHGLPPLEVTVV